MVGVTIGESAPLPFRLRVQRVGELDVARWRRFSQDAELEFNLDFLRYADEAGAGDRLILIAEQQEEFVGALQVTRVTDRSFWLSRPAAVLSDALGSDAVGRQYEDCLYPTVAVRNLSDANLLVVPPGRTEIVKFLIEGLRHVAETWGARSVTFLNVSSDDTDLRTVLSSTGFAAALYTADAVIELGAAQDLDGYLAALPRGRRVHARNEISRFRRCGFLVEEAGLDALAEVVRQEAATWAKYGNDVGFDSLWRLRAPLATHLSRHTRLVVCRDKRGTILASAAHLIGRRRYHCFTYGATAEAPSGSYAMVTFYEPIQYAAAHGLPLVMLGDTSLRAKALRGARVREVMAYTLAYSQSGREYYDQLAARLDVHVRAQIPELAKLDF